MFLKKIILVAQAKYIDLQNRLYAKLYNVNAKEYWDKRFSMNWEQRNGRLQTTLFATGFALLSTKFERIASVLDYGCGLADAMPTLKMRFPEASLYYYDFSDEAMKKAGQYYSSLASPLPNSAQKFDIVYCSNVLEHISELDLNHFCKTLLSYTQKYIVIQAPYNQRHPNGDEINEQTGFIEEHVRTVNDSFLAYISQLDAGYTWHIELKKIPIAWPFGSQIFIIGVKK